MASKDSGVDFTFDQREESKIQQQQRQQQPGPSAVQSSQHSKRSRSQQTSQSLPPLNTPSSSRTKWIIGPDDNSTPDTPYPYATCDEAMEAFEREDLKIYFRLLAEAAGLFEIAILNRDKEDIELSSKAYDRLLRLVGGQSVVIRYNEAHDDHAFQTKAQNMAKHLVHERKARAEDVGEVVQGLIRDWSPRIAIRERELVKYLPDKPVEGFYWI